MTQFFRLPSPPSCEEICSKIIPSFFVDKASCTRQFESELSLHSLASLFPIKEGSTSHLGLLPSGKKRKPLLSIVFTPPSVPLVGDRDVARNHFILWLADHQRSSPAAELHFAVCDRMDTNRLQAACSMLAARCWLLNTGCLLDACCLLSAHLMLACCLLVIAAKGYLESFSVNMFLRKRVLPRM